MHEHRYSYQQLERFSVDAFERLGFSRQESQIITDVLLLSDLYGIASHGLQRLARYHKGIEQGLLRVDAKPRLVFETPVSAVLDGQGGMGQLVGHDAMRRAIEKAQKTGIGSVVVRNSNHYGIAGYYAKLASDQGLIGLATTNTEAIMVPTYGQQAMLGTNPIAVAMPADPYPFFFDSSTAVVTRGKLEVYRKNEAALPLGWALDQQGLDTTDTEAVLDNIAAKAGGGILPLGGSSEQTGGHKGYGLALLVELFTGILALGATSNKTMVDGVPGICHAFAAIDPAIYGDPDAIRAHLSDYLVQLRQSPKASGQERIYTHGEKEILAQEDRLVRGIPIDGKTWQELLAFAAYAGLDPASYFGLPPNC